MALQIIVTNAGRAALINATNSGTLPVTIARVGLSATAVTPAANLTALPNEIKRLDTLSGAGVGGDTLHLTVRDETSDTYTVRSFAIYLADNTLFAIYGQPGAIIDKASQALLLASMDIQFADIAASAITFGNANFINPPATTTAQGVVELATSAETETGTDQTRALTSKGASDVYLKKSGGTMSGSFSMIGVQMPAIRLTRSEVADWYVGGSSSLNDNSFGVRLNAGTPILSIGTDEIVSLKGAVRAGLGFSSSGMIRATGQSLAGINNAAGVELQYDGSSGIVMAYDRANSAYKSLNIYGSNVTMVAQGGGTIALTGGLVTTPTQVRVGVTTGTAGLITLGAGAGATVSGSIDFRSAANILIGYIQQTAPTGAINYVNLTGVGHIFSGGALTSTTQVNAGASGTNGFIRMALGGTTATGYLEFLNAAGARNGYIQQNFNGPIVFTNDLGGGYVFNGGGLTINNGGISVGGNIVYHSGNDGAGSGMDADLLDGVQGSGYLRRDVNSGSPGGNQTAMPAASTAAANAPIVFREAAYGGAGTGTLSSAPRIGFQWAGRASTQIIMRADGALAAYDDNMGGLRPLYVSNLFVNDQPVWHAGNSADLARRSGATFTGQVVMAADLVVERAGDVPAIYFHRPGNVLWEVGGYGHGFGFGFRIQGDAQPAFGIDGNRNTFVTNALTVKGAMLADTDKPVWHAGNLGNAFPRSLAGNGYQALPGGLIFQWVTGVEVASGEGSQVLYFPIVFPNACVGVNVSTAVGWETPDGDVEYQVIGAPSTASVIVKRQADDRVNVTATPFIIAIGY